MIVGNLVIKIGGDLSGYAKAVSDVMAKSQAMSQRLAGLGSRLTTGLTLPIVGAGAAAVKVASDVEEMRSKFNAVFKGLSGEVEQWAATHAAAIGRSRFDLQNYAADVQDTFVPLGFARDEASKMSRAVVELAEDLASFKNLRTEDVVRGLTSALVGNVENLRQFGVVANEAQIKQKALQLGIIQTTKDAITPQQKALAIWQLTLEGTVDAQGDATRTAGSFANRMRALQSSFKDAAVELGQRLMPVAEQLVTWAGQAIDWFKNLSPEVKNMAVAFGLAAAAAGPLLVAVAAIISPIGLAITAIGALAAAGYYLATNWDTVKEWWNLFWDEMANIAVAGAGLVIKKIIDQFALLGQIQLLPSITIDDLFPSLGTVAEDLKERVDDLVGTIGGPEAQGRMKQMEALIDDLQDAFANFSIEDFTDKIKNVGAGALAYLQPVLDLIEKITRASAGGGGGGGGRQPLTAKVGLGQSGQGFESPFGALATQAQASFDLFNAAATTGVKAAGKLGTEIKTQLVHSMATFGDVTGAAFGGMLTGTKSVKAALIDLGNIASNVINGILGSLFKFGIGLGLNALFPGSGLISGVFGGVPKLASGGIVNRPTLAMIGEAGPEAVVPLKNAGALSGIALSGNLRVGIGELYVELEQYSRDNRHGPLGG